MTISRSKLLCAGAGLGVLGPALLAAFTPVAAQAAEDSDNMSIQLAITVESTLIKAYQEALTLNILVPKDREALNGFLQDHFAHREALINVVKSAGGTPIEANVTIKLPASVKSEVDILKILQNLERKAASSCLGTLGDLKKSGLIKLVASILGVETTHVAILGTALSQGYEPYKSSFVM